MTHSSSDRPKIDVPMERTDKLLDWTTIGILLLLIGLPLASYSSLPARIPIHFDLAGTPDQYGPKLLLWLLPLISIILFFLMRFLSGIPHVHNYPFPITEVNAETCYRISSRTLRIVNLVSLAILLYLVWQTVSVARGNAFGIGPWFIVVVVAAFTATLVYAYVCLKRANRFHGDRS